MWISNTREIVSFLSQKFNHYFPCFNKFWEQLNPCCVSKFKIILNWENFNYVSWEIKSKEKFNLKLKFCISPTAVCMVTIASFRFVTSWCHKYKYNVKQSCWLQNNLQVYVLVWILIFILLQVYVLVIIMLELPLGRKMWRWSHSCSCILQWLRCKTMNFELQNSVTVLY